MSKVKRRPGSGENGPLILAFFLPVLMMLAIFAGKGIYPFGDNSFLRTDMYHQYAPFFAEFWRKMREGGSLFYTWDVGLGTNFAALFGYYLSSPANWLLLLCPRGFIIEFMTYLLVIKVGLCGWSMTYYLSRHFKEKTVGMALFGSMYAMSAYMAAYSWNIMWLDCLWLMPLILLGLERLMDEGKCLLYCLTLAMAILTNYYIAIMICIFLVLWFIARLFMLPEREKVPEERDGETVLVPKKRSIPMMFVRFAVYSLLAGGIAAVILLPEAFALSGTASGSISFPKRLSSYFSAFDMLVRHLTLVEVETGLDHWPNLYSGLPCIPLFILYLTDRSVRAREKAVKCALLLLFLASFSMNIPNFVWHGLHYPNSLPCRQSFLYTIVLLTMCYEALRNLSVQPREKIAFAVFASLGFVLLAEKLADEGLNIPFWTYYANAAFLGIYGMLAAGYRLKRRARSGILVAFVGILTLELTLNMAVTSITTVRRSGYLNYLKEITELTDKADAISANEGFYRTEREGRRTKDDGAWYGYRSASIFSSTANAKISSFYRKIGQEGSTNAFSFNGATPFTKALLRVRYTLTSRTEPVPGLESEAAVSGSLRLMKNEYVLPLAFAIPTDVDAFWTDAVSKVDNQNRFIAMTDEEGGEDLFYLVSDYAASDSVTLFFPEDGYYVAELSNKNSEDVKVSYNGKNTTWNDIDRGYLIDLGWCTAGSEATVTPGESDKTVALKLYGMKTERLKEYVARMSEGGMTVTSFADTRVTGTVDLKEDATLFTSIPFDKGWTARVDGVRTEITAFSDAFVSIPVSAGSHNIEFTFEPAGLHYGNMLSLISAALLVLILCLKKLLTGWKEQKAAKAADEAEPAVQSAPAQDAGSDGAAADASARPEESAAKAPETSGETAPEKEEKA